MKVSQSKMEYVCEKEGTMRLRGVRIAAWRISGSTAQRMERVEKWERSGKKRQEAELGVAKMKMLSFSLGVM